MILNDQIGVAIPRTRFIYDPYIKGFDTNFWKQLTGTTTVSSNQLSLNVAEMASYSQYTSGMFEFALNVPSVPAGGKSKIWGLYNKANPTQGSAYFQITGATFQAVVYDETGTLYTQAITWKTGTWNGSVHTYTILDNVNNVIFSIDGTVVATINANCSRSQALYINNADAENLLVSYLTVLNAGLLVS